MFKDDKFGSGKSVITLLEFGINKNCPGQLRLESLWVQEHVQGKIFATGQQECVNSQ
jgi:hypothetical protein